MKAVVNGQEAQLFHGLDRAALLDVYRTMLLSRRLDDKEIQLKAQSQIFFQISGAGHEAVLVAAGLTLKTGLRLVLPLLSRSRAVPAARRHAARHAARRRSARKTIRPPADGRCRRTGATRALNIVSGSSATGTQVLHAVGAAEAGVIYSRVPQIPDRESRYHADEITYVSLGDGATSEGEFWEALNVTCIKQLPVLFLVEDNGYAISVPVEDPDRRRRHLPARAIVSRPARRFDRRHRFLRQPPRHARRGRATSARARVRRSSTRTSFDRTRIPCPTTRSCTRRRRSAKPRRAAIRSRAFASSSSTNGLATDEDLAAIRRDVDRELDEAAAKALAAPKPPKNTAELWVYSPDVDPCSSAFDTPAGHEGKPDTMVGVINRTLKDEMARDPRIVVFGEDVADASRREALTLVPGKGGVFKLTHGLQRSYGDDRVFNSPLAEASIVGRAIGMATRKLKPVVEIQFFDYIWPAMMQIRDELTMMRYRSGNNWSCPMVIRVPIGGYLRGGGPYHSQSGESIFAHCPGIRIVVSVQRRWTPRACYGRRFAATIRSCSSNTNICIARLTTRANIPATTS